MLAEDVISPAVGVMLLTHNSSVGNPDPSPFPETIISGKKQSILFLIIVF